jgi:hypothetical protein
MKNIAKKSTNEESNIVQFPDPVADLQKTLTIFSLPDRVAVLEQSLQNLHKKLDALQKFMVKFSDNIELGDRYMGPKKAMDYLDMTEGTFDKYRYHTIVKIKSYKLDNSNRYKKSDLDRFMLLNEDGPFSSRK